MEYYCIFVKGGEEEQFKKKAQEKVSEIEPNSKFYFFTEETWNKKAKYNQKVIRAAFPGYVFLRVEKLTEEIKYIIRKTNGFIRFLIANDNITKIDGLGSERLISFIETGEHHAMSTAVYEEGSKVRITSGDIKLFEAYIVKWDPKHQKVRVQLPNQSISWTFELSYEMKMEQLPDDETSRLLKNNKVE